MTEAEAALQHVNWGPDPDAPPIKMLAYTYDEATGKPIEPPGLAVMRQKLAHIAFEYGVLRTGQDPEQVKSWQPAARSWLRFISRPDRLEHYAGSLVDLAYDQHEKWTEARTDELTGLPNRKRWLEDVVQAYKWVNEPLPTPEEGSEEPQKQRALLLEFSDLDGFKGINDEKGHNAGNVALALLGRVFIGVGRREGRDGMPPDLVARLHGDEFVANRWILSADPESTATDMVARLQLGLDAEMPVINAELAKIPNKPPKDGEAPSNYRPKLSTSVGFALLKRGDTIEDFIARADEAMYAVKEGRKDLMAAGEVVGLSEEDKTYLREAARVVEQMATQRATFHGLSRLNRAIDAQG